MTINRKRMIIMLGASILVFGGVFGFIAFRNYMIGQFFANMPQPVVAVTAAPAESQNWQQAVPAVGVLESQNGVDVSAAVPGLIKEIDFQPGQTVKRGDLLVRLDADVELGDLHSAQADLEVARTAALRSRALARSNTVSEAALERAEGDLKMREARVAALAAQIGKKSIAAPFDGALGVRKVDLGQYLQPGQPVVNLQDLSAMLANFSLSQKELARLSVGHPIRVTTDAYGDRIFEGVVSTIEPAVDAATGMVMVQGRIPNPDGALRPGMFARIELVVPGEREIVAVPQTAISYNLHGDTAFIIKAGRDDSGNEVLEATRIVVELGARRNGMVAVTKGVAAGDMVVTSGQLKLQQGSRVTIAAEDPLKPKQAALR